MGSTDGAADYDDHFLKFESGDDLVDYLYSPLYDAGTVPPADKSGLEEGGGVPWEAINVDDPDTTQVPESWTDTSSPLNTEADTQPPYPGEGYVNINLYPPYDLTSDLNKPGVNHTPDANGPDPSFNLGGGGTPPTPPTPPATEIGTVTVTGPGSDGSDVAAGSQAYQVTADSLSLIHI